MKLTIYLGICPNRVDVILDKSTIDKDQYLRVDEKTIDIPERLLKKRMERATKARVYTTCYGTRKEWDSKDKAIAFFKEAAANSDGCERSRYVNILLKLMDGETDVDDQP